MTTASNTDFTLRFENRVLPKSFSPDAWVLVISCVLIGTFAVAQAQQPGRAVMQGTVRDSSGSPVASASVSVGQGHGVRPITTTGQDGSFTLADLHPGMLKVRVEKSGFCRLVVDANAIPRGLPLDLVLTKAEKGSGNCSTSSIKPNLKVELEDKPSFTIAGITDWSGAGGHGSDTTLPTSETLTRDTLALKSPPSSQHCPAEQESELRAAVAATPQSFDANHKLGQFYLTCDRFSQAIPLLETAFRIKPDEPQNTFQLALAYRLAGELNKARAQAARLLAQRDSSDARRLLGDIDELQNDPVAAVHEYEHATRLEPNEQNYFDWGTELLLHRAVQPAIEVFTKATQAHPDSPRLLAALGAALYASGAYDEAAKRICSASGLDPTDDGPYLFLGTMQKSVHQSLPCALETLARFAQQKPHVALANYYYAIALWKTTRRNGDSSNSRHIESLLNEAVALNPKLGEAYLQLGMLYSAQGNLEKAAGAYQRAIDADPTLSEAHYELGLAYKRLGKDADAGREFQAYAQVQKANTEAAEQRRREVRQFVIAMADHAETKSPR